MAMEQTPLAPTPAFADRTLVCVECGAPFSWDAGEQEWFAKKGFLPPRRCPPCRALRRTRRGVG